MDTVGALRHYRMALVKDAVSYELLAFLYKDGTLSEDELLERSDTTAPDTKFRLRKLYQANFIKLDRSGRFYLTDFASRTLSSYGVGRVILPHLINELLDPPHREEVLILCNLAMDADTKRQHHIRRALLNIKKITSESEIRSEDKRDLAFFALVHPDSATRVALNNVVFHFSNAEARGSESRYATFEPYIDRYRWLHRCLLDSDEIISHSADQLVNARIFSADAASYTSWRMFNYLETSERDLLFERCQAYGVRTTENVMTFLSEKFRTAAKTGVDSVFTSALAVLFPTLDSIMSVSSAISTLSERLVDVYRRKTSLDPITQSNVTTPLTFAGDETAAEGSISDVLLQLGGAESALTEDAVRSAGADELATASAVVERVHGALSTELKRRKRSDPKR